MTRYAALRRLRASQAKPHARGAETLEKVRLAGPGHSWSCLLCDCFSPSKRQRGLIDAHVGERRVRGKKQGAIMRT